MRVLVRARALSRDAALAVEHRRLGGVSVSDSSPSGRGHAGLAAGALCAPFSIAREPVLVEDVEPPSGGPGDPGQAQMRLLREGEAPAPQIRPGEVREVQGRRSAEERELETVGAAVVVWRCPVQYHHSSVASGCEPWSRGNEVGAERGGRTAAARRRDRERGARRLPAHSSCSAAAGSTAAAMRPGRIPATTDASEHQRGGGRASVATGTSSATVQPKDCGLITERSSHAKAAPAGERGSRAATPGQERLEERRAPDLPARGAHRAQQTEGPPPLDGGGDQRVGDAQHGDRDRDRLERLA